MTISTAVKWAVSSMTGAPTLNGTAGSLIAVLDAFLVNGFGTKAVDSAVVTNGICRMAITGGSAVQDHCVIQLAGVTGDGAVLNGLQRVNTATTSYVEFACDLPDGPLTGAITFKIAPLGWEKVFSKTNVGVYRSTDPAGTRAYYRVDDTNALYTRVTMYESMTDVDTGVAATPTSPAGGFYWHKRTSAAATGVYWVLRGDSRGFYISVAPQAATSPATSGGYGLYTHYAGDLNSYRSGDAWGAVLTGALSTTYTDLSGCVFTANGVTGGLVLQRMSAGLGGAVQVSRAITGNTAATSGNDATLGVYPSRADNGLRLSPIMLSDGVMGNFGPRGELPGAYHCPQTGLVGAMGTDAFMTPGQGVYSNRRLQSVGGGSVSAAALGCGFIDITGPWR
jgi:hypothetical protein